MDNLYERIILLCKSRGIAGGKMCDILGLSKSMLTDLKMGRKKTINIETAAKIAEYFNVSSDYLLGINDEPTVQNEKRPVYDDEAWEMMREMYERPELRALFSTSKNVRPEDIKAVDELLKRMAGRDEDDF